MPTLTLDPDLDNLAIARAFVIDYAEDRVADFESVLVMASELVTNVFVHAKTPVTLTLRLGPPLRIEVGDQGAAAAAFREILQNGPASPAATSVGGRGLCIVHASAARVGLDINPEGGKVVWFEM